MEGRTRWILRDQRMMLAMVILLIITAISLVNPRFIALKNIITILQQISVLGILTMAMSLLLISGGIDLSVGNIMILSGVVMSKVMMLGGDVLPAVLAGLLTGALCGVLNGVIIAKSRCIPLIITLGTSLMFYGTALTISEGRIMSFRGRLNGLKYRIFEVFPVMLLVLLGMILIAYFLLNITKFGRRIVAVGGNEKNAFLSGIPVERYKIAVYALAGFFCAVASLVFAARIDSITANGGAGYETRALTAAIIGGVTFEGGRGTVSGAFLGCLLMGVISNAMNILQVTSYTQTIVTGLIIVSAVILSNIHNIGKRS